MQKMQEVFSRIQTSKKKQKKIKAVFKEAFDSSSEYQKADEDCKNARDAKRQIKDKIESDFKSEFDKLDKIKMDIETDNILLSDMAVNCIAKGEPIEISDDYQNKYEPLISVKFKKI
ncbi:MAG: hypothetical protein U9O66_03440 [Patescibacteria group bacterium]|nr:hypothetical protein [Patescibacteria group bacterium]